MTQKNKIFSITLLLLILGSVACRKSGGGGPTQTDPIKSLTGNLLIVSTDGTKGANSLPLSFVGASATVSDVKVGQGGDILLFPTNFIIENGNLYLTNLTTTNKDGGEVKAAVSNKITLTFSLSGENLSRYTDTADIFVGKMQTNIGTNDFAKKLSGKIDNNQELFGNKNNEQKIRFDFNHELSKDSNNYLVFTNALDGDNKNLIAINSEGGTHNFYSNFHKIIQADWQSFGDSFLIETSIEEKTNAIVKLKFEPATFYEPYMFKFIMKNGEWVTTNANPIQ
ncbi:hypothetical protein [uncultured Brachyspira sp.]|jgi:hypothetical protein|uniref:hypothetical protein n=1 Tax=uncultured Brachyspira sp. TaxID=221953 RepID=UPI00258317B3|nr:hypothetical protein [uncultured Brachyspira sp.]